MDWDWSKGILCLKTFVDICTPFTCLELIINFQTIIFYDGLAGTFSEISTLFAGVSAVLVAFIFKMRYRGVVFNWTPKAWKDVVEEFGGFVSSYHGYLSSFGTYLNGL